MTDNILRSDSRLGWFLFLKYHRCRLHSGLAVRARVVGASSAGARSSSRAARVATRCGTAAEAAKRRTGGITSNTAKLSSN
eukprot:COSAG01_NODE_1006_length_12163_cov_237.845669_9_plen_81_part_00